MYNTSSEFNVSRKQWNVPIGTATEGDTNKLAGRHTIGVINNTSLSHINCVVPSKSINSLKVGKFYIRF